MKYKAKNVRTNEIYIIEKAEFDSKGYLVHLKVKGIWAIDDPSNWEIVPEK